MACYHSITTIILMIVVIDIFKVTRRQSMRVRRPLRGAGSFRNVDVASTHVEEQVATCACAGKVREIGKGRHSNPYSTWIRILGRI